ncbi:hypothetical protein [uncultured Croceicoccus sp.]|uniref:alpha/beta hydrolase n=1 Tax=uncultured Croceicoccus sp. TaxID=1295329 RepID=UPI002633011A|nr:hypothetical protein [uncultured Croceicoccus sp.]
MLKSRFLSAALAFSLCACNTATASPPQSVADTPPAATMVTVPVDGRELRISVFRPAEAPRGVLFLSHGAGGSPEMMRPLIDRLIGAGFAVVAPLHRDSMTYPAQDREDLQSAFATRIADLQATSAVADRLFPGLPYGGVGYSYGSLFALIGGGALKDMVGASVPAMKAVATFSSPGLIPGVVTDAGLQGVSVPTLMITGTRDMVTGFIPDPAAHVHYFENEPAGGRYLAIVDGASHDFVYGQEPGYDAAIDITVRFLQAYVLGDGAALRMLNDTESRGLIEFRRR